MRIVIDGRCILNQLDGTGRFAINVINELPKADPDLSLIALIRSDVSHNIRNKIPESVQFVNIQYSHIHPYTAFCLGNLVDSLESDLFLSLHMLQPLMMNTPSVTTVHDTMWLNKTWTQAQGKPLRRLAGKLYFQSLVELSTRKARKIIVPSKSTYKDVSEVWPDRCNDFHVVYPGIDPLFLETDNRLQACERINRLGLSGNNFFLHISNGKPYKNTPRVIEAFVNIAGSSNAKLAIVGSKSVFTASIQSLIGETGVAERIKFLGSVDDEDVAALFRRSTALVFPSLFEGFGLPVIEAMASRCPVITSTRGSLAEVSGDSALIVNPENVDEIANAMVRLENDDSLRQSLIKTGFQRAQRFSWTKAAMEILKVSKLALLPIKE